jgi:hypothetical protein
MCEHRDHLDFGANSTAYVAASMRDIDRAAVHMRCQNAAVEVA